MYKSFITLSLAILFSCGVSAQQPLELTFTAIDSTYYTQLDSIRIMNITRDCDTVLQWNDTTLVLDTYVGMTELANNKQFTVVAYPNPASEKAKLNICVPVPGKTYVSVSDVQGRLIHLESFNLNAGSHDFDFNPGGDAMYFISFSWQGNTRHLKLINASPEKGRESIFSYVGSIDQIVKRKSSAPNDYFEFSLGDQLLFIGYTDTLESGIIETPMDSKTYTFQFAYNIPCIGTPTVEYEGQQYNTVQIFSQCWLKENMNVGSMIPATQSMSDNDVIEKYCYNDEPDSCSKLGGLYQWDEVMQYSTLPEEKGICPPGWHIPTHEEWQILEGATDSQYGIGDPEWGFTRGWYGYDAGSNLKSISNWTENGNGTNLYGFSALPGGSRYAPGTIGYGDYGTFWSSSQTGELSIWVRSLKYNRSKVWRYEDHKGYGRSVRCIQD